MNKTAKKKLLVAPLALAGVIAVSGIAVPVRSLAMADTATKSSSAKYTSSYSSKEEARQAGLDLNYEIAAEGAVLLKNENAALPVKITETETPSEKPNQPPTVTRSGNKISVFGYGSIAPNGGGSVNDAEASAGTVTFNSTFYNSIEDAGYEVNPKLKGLYEGALNDSTVNSDKDIDIENYSLPSFESSYSTYNDAAVIILGNTSGDGTAHALQYGQSQKDLVDFVAGKFEKVIVLINKSVPMEIDWLKKHAGVDAILLVGEAGTNGLDVTGPLLAGTINPSGRLVDTYAVDQTKVPSYVNYNKAGISNMMSANDTYKTYKVDGQDTDTYFVEYEEGIYVGYRYWETRGYVENQKAGATEDEWYNNNVSYTFGYGLSYTTFTQEILSTSTAAGAITANDTIRFDVKVKNTGNVAGKEVVQLYYTAPYIENGIEKSHVELAAFAKTDLLEPQAEQTLTLEIKVADMASYDYNDANSNQHEGYELDEGTYTVKLMKNAHDVIDSRDYTLAAKANVKDEVHNLFEDSNQYIENKSMHLMSRTDFEGTFPTAVTEAEREMSADEYEKFKYTIVDNPDDEMPTQAATAKTAAETTVKLADLAGKSYDDPLWEELLNQLTVEEMADLFGNGGFHSEAMENIGKPYSHDTDGPLGWTGTGVSGISYNRFASEPVIASTWNVELAEKMGEMIGEQGLWGSSDRTDGGGIYAYTGWYAPGMNLHRSAFDARYTEYYSEDGLLMGKIVAGVSRGLNSKGGYLFIKHFALHNDGAGVMNYRGNMSNPSQTAGLAVWASEQTMREIYFQAYEIAVKEGHARAAMSAFNNIGYTWAGANKALLTDLLRTEWGFEGFVVTDIAIYAQRMDGDAIVRAGGDLILKGFTGDVTEKTTGTATGVKALRQATKNILYVVANSNAMNAPCGAKVNLSRAADYANTATVGTAYTATLGGEDLAALNTIYAYDDIKYSATGLPAGLTINENTGVISGTPTEAGVYTVKVTASAEGYEDGVQEYTLLVQSAGSTGTTPDGEGDGSGCGSCSSSLNGAFALTLTAGAALLIGGMMIIRKSRKNK